jgi:hypothetical protein
MKKTISKLSAIAFLFLSVNSWAQLPEKIYANAFQTMHDQGVWSRAMTKDNLGNSYVTGLFHGTVDFDPSAATTNLTYQGGTLNDLDGESDVFIAKYDASGNLLWAKNLIEPTFSGMNEERASAITIDANNNLYLTGFTNTRGFFISKWDENGTELWSKYFDDVTTNSVVTFAIKTVNTSVVVSGIFRESMDFDPSPTAETSLTAINSDGFLLALSSNGDFEWVKQFKTNGGVLLSGMDTDASGNIVLAGIFLGTVDFNPSPTQQSNLTSLSTSNGAISSGFIAKYDNQGNFLWTKHLRGSSTTDFFTLLIQRDYNNDLVVSGSFKGAVAFLPASATLQSNENYNSFVAKFNTDGTLLWKNRIAITDGFLQSSLNANLALDHCGNVYVSGEFSGTCDFDPSAATQELQSLTNLRSVYLAMYGADGSYKWAMQIGGLGGPDFVEFNGYLPILIDNDDNLVASGTFRSTMDFDPSSGDFTLNSNSGGSPNIAGFFMAKYSNPISCALAVTDFEKNTIIVYPNPASSQVTIQFEDFKTNFNVRIVDQTGKVVFNKENESAKQFSIALPNLQKGIYIVEIKSEYTTYQQKLIIE